MEGDVWVDVLHADSLPVVEIELYGNTYFGLLRLLPELQRWLSAFDQVVIAGAEISIRIVTEEVPPVEGPALSRLVREFGGR